MNISVELLRSILALAFLIPIAWQDYKENRISNKMLLRWIIARCLLFVYEGMVQPERIKWTVISCIAAMVVVVFMFLIVNAITKGGIGMGDIKLLAVIGFTFGVQAGFGVMLYSALAAAIGGVVLMVLKKADKKSRIPFAPFVLAGMILVIVFT